jgi:hypothetical protein
MSVRSYLGIPDDLKEIEVSEKEFLKLLIDHAGMTEEKAKLQAKIARIMGSAVKIGDKMVSITPEPKTPEEEKVEKEAQESVDKMLRERGLIE